MKDERDELAAWMAAYCEGEVDAFSKIYARLAPRLLAYAMSLLRRRAAAEDALQQSFARLHVARSAYVRGADPTPWLFAIVRNACRDEQRRQRRARVVPMEAPPEVGVQIDGVADASRPLFDEGLVAWVVSALDLLPVNQRNVVKLTKIEGKTTAEAAEILGTTSGAVKLRSHRAYVRLRALAV